MQISILGCGWLGLPLAKSLIEKGFAVNGSTTSVEKISVLESLGIHPSIVTLSTVEGQNNEKEIIPFLQNSEVLVINIPPKLRRDSSENFVEKIKNFIPFIENSTIKKVIFVSSTSVYAEIPLDTSTSSVQAAIEKKLTITEETIPIPDTESGKQLLEVEKLLQSNKHFQTTVIRFGGLIGENRHPIHFLSGRKNIENPDAPINLIHRDDCIGIIEKILKQDQNDNLDWSEVFNAVAPFHPTRKEYYTQKAKALNLPLPEFEEKNKVAGKIISSEKIETILNYQYQKPSL